MDWRDHLKSVTVSADEAVKVVMSGDRLFVQGAAATPHRLIEALMKRAPELTGVEIVHIHTDGPARYVEPDMAGHFFHKALFIGSNVREAVNNGRADYLPVFLSDIPHLFRSGELSIDVAFINVSWPDSHGYCSYGTSVDCAKAAAESASLVVAQLNSRMPRTLGNSFIHVTNIDYAVEVDEPPIEVVPTAPTETELRIGAYVSELIPDGATIQTGIGGIPNAVLQQLKKARNLGVHSEMISDGVVDLIESGVINGSCKTIHPGKVVCAFLMGSKRLYEFVHDNPVMEMMPAEHTNDTAVIRRNFRMTAINSALQVDLTGQVCAESIGYKLHSGVGGQMDFMRGAALSEGGKAIIALPSTAGNGKYSRIVPLLDIGAGVTTTRAHVQYVVTEYGIAYLRGNSLRERAVALIEIAHPKFRDELARYAFERKWLPSHTFYIPNGHLHKSPEPVEVKAADK